MSLLDQFNNDGDSAAPYTSSSYGAALAGGYGGGGSGGGGGGGFGSGLGSAGAAYGVSTGFDDTYDDFGGSGFVAAFQDDELPLFENRRVDIGPMSPGQQITHMAVSSSVLVLAMSNNNLLKVLTSNPPEDRQAIDLGRRPDDRIVGLFMDPTASHIIVCLRNEKERQFESLYIPPGSTKPVALKKFKGYRVTAVGWNPEGKRDFRGTREILIGTVGGAIFETDIEKDVKYFRQVYKVDAEPPEPICGLRVDRVTRNARPDERKFFIMVATRRQSFQFMGAGNPDSPTYGNILGNNQNRRPIELPGEIDESALAFFAPYPNPPESFAWLAGCGVSYGFFDFKNPHSHRGHAKQEPIETVMKGQQPSLWEYAKGDEQPIAIAMTEFHLIILFRERYSALCLLNEKIVLSESLQGGGRGMLGLAYDPVMELIYAYSPRVIYRIDPKHETRDVWQLYLDNQQYSKAREYANTPQQKDKVTTAEAEQLFSQGDFVRAADLFAKTQRSFEEVALRFLQSGEIEALKSFLLRKLKTLQAREKTQLTMVCTWLVEIYLNTLNSLKDEGDTEGYKILQNEFREFLQDPRVEQNLDKPTAYDLIASHGNVEDLTFFASLIEDFERVISHHVQSAEYLQALEMLYCQPNLELYYRFAPTLMQHVPRETVEACIRRPELDPRQLIPAFIKCYQQNESWEQDSEARSQSIRYLEWCVGDSMRNRDPAIHNYLLSLYAKLPDDGPLLHFLEKHGDEPLYDLKYALRLCTQEAKKRACVTIYSTMGLYEEAVDHALSVDLTLAMRNADAAVDDEDLRKKLWLRIAKHVVMEEKNIDKAMQVMQRNDLLKIEDILPFFPDFVTIDHFKDAICTSLEDYNHDIEKLKTDMFAATESAKAIRKDIADLQNKYTVVSAKDKCRLSGFPLLSRPFYTFPACGCGFIAEYLIAEVKKHLRPFELRRVEEIEDQLAGGDLTRSARAALEAELDDVVCEDCPLCGEVLIETIDETFVKPEDQAAYISKWTLE